MIKKEKFIELIEFIKDQRNLEDNLYDAFKAISDDTQGLFLFSKYEDKLVYLIHNSLDLSEEDDILEWWLYDTQFGSDHATIYLKDNTEINLTTAGDLYDYITTKQ